ncbi:MAG: response regulator [Chlorobi bacterium]|nr:response regulator [Chlorobiota bacterium]
MNEDKNNPEENIDAKFGKILIIDDDPFIIKLIKKYLAKQKLEVLVARTGSEALKMVDDSSDFDLLILDILLPDMTGYDVSKAIREKRSLFQLPILMLTAKTDIYDKLAGFDAGANDYLVKPFNSMEFTARANTLIKMKRLTQSNKVLQEAIEIKNQFLNMTIHDLRNPLGVIMGGAKMIQNEGGLNKNADELLDLILESSDVMMNLVNELLVTAKIESGKTTLNKALININELVTDSIDKNLLNALKKSQDIVFGHDESFEGFIEGDPIRITEILDNILSNAIKYSPLRETISISVKQATNKFKDSIVRIEVEDNGPGFSKDDLSKIFGAFQKLSAQPTGGESSSGLGLSIVKKLVELHNGKISVQSKLGKGSKFIIDFLLVEKSI